MQLVKFSNANLTMSSREIAELSCKEHKTVLRDIRAMLINLYGEEHLEQVIPEHYRNRHSEYIRENADEILSSIFEDGTNRYHQEKRGFNWNRDNRGYISVINLDREHTITLVAGYDVKLRKRIIDRWMELETQSAGGNVGQHQHLTLESAMSIAREGAKLARAFGFKGNMIALSGNTLAKTVTGVDMLALMGATHLIADPRGMTYTPTELGAMCDPKLSAIKFNLLLEAAGLQTKEFGSWLPTDAADGKFEWLDTNKRHTDGTPVKQIKWFSSVLNDVAAPKIRATA